MTIRFRCPNPSCKKVLGVPDHLAGRKANCPACKKAFRIPARKGPPKPVPANVEELAARALADEPAAAAAAEKPQSIQVECPFCAEQVEFPLEMGGKQAPCPNPECRRIIKVPMPAEEKKADWRTAGRDGPVGAKENFEKMLEAEQAANIKRGVVSAGAMEAAGALPTREAPLTTGQKVGLWTRRVFVTALAAGAVFAVWAWWYQRTGITEQTGPLAEVLPWLEEVKGATSTVSPEERKKFSKEHPTLAAELSRAVGEFYVRDHDATVSESAEQAKRAFIRARVLLRENKVAGTPAAEILLAGIALNQVELAGTPAEVDKKVRQDWPEVRRELSQTLHQLTSLDGQLFALRQVGGRLLERGQGPLAVGLARELGAGTRQGSALLLEGQQVALLLAQKQADQAAKLLAPPKAGVPLDLATRLAYAEGRAREGNFEEARKLAQEKGPAADQMRTALAVAEIALDANRPAEAATNLADALKVLAAEQKRKAPLRPLLQWEAARLAARVGQPALARDVIKGIRDPGCAARAELELLFQSIAEKANAVDPDAVANKKTLAYAQAQEAVARYRTAQGQRGAVVEDAARLEDVQLRPFVFVGIALGEQDKGRPRTRQP